ncbi:hypothetical protein [Rhizobium sp. CB3060]|uniref:hypothetical protein n=1 Tax=Rhizobium sp. CB3060 TaxID=3138255 RepID=UPI004053E77E
MDIYSGGVGRRHRFIHSAKISSFANMAFPISSSSAAENTCIGSTARYGMELGYHVTSFATRPRTFTHEMMQPPSSIG